jgi:hypothetical protein
VLDGLPAQTHGSVNSVLGIEAGDQGTGHNFLWEHEQ